MSINLSVPQDETVELKPRISVIGVGGAGGNAVNNMIAANLEGVEFLVANTDAQALTYSTTDRRIQLGTSLTQGLGAGSKPEIGRAAAEETIDEINEQLKGSHMVFIAAGMGGGTGTGAAPVIARAARDLGILTVGVVTKPFQFEGANRQRLAAKGIEELEQYVDTLIIIPNQNLFRVANEKTTFSDAFKMADDVLYSGVRGVTDLMVMPGLINLDFADVRSVMSAMGKAMMGTGEAEGERRALEAAEAAISNPLLDDTSMAGAQGVLINITGGGDMTLFEVDEAANRIRAEVDEDAYIIFGSTFDDSLNGRMRVSVVATGIDAEAQVRPQPVYLNMHDDAVSQMQVPAEEPKPHVAKDESVEHRVAEILRQNVDADDEPEADPVDEPVMTEKSGDDDAASSTHADVTDGYGDNSAQAEEHAPDASVVNASHSVPAAMPSAGEHDAFIPPAPAQTETHELDLIAQAASLSTVSDETDDAQHAALHAHNEAPTQSAPPSRPVPEPAKAPNLFERVTGGARAKVPLFGSSKPEPKAATATSAVAQTAASSSTQGTPQTAPQMRPTSNVEPKLGGLDLEERLQTSQTEEDLLEIPAFLRRQAN